MPRKKVNVVTNATLNMFSGSTADMQEKVNLIDENVDLLEIEFSKLLTAYSGTASKVTKNTQDITNLTQSHNTLRIDHTNLSNLVGQHSNTLTTHSELLDGLRTDHDSLRIDHDLVRIDHDKLRAEHDNLESLHSRLRDDHNTLDSVVSDNTSRIQVLEDTASSPGNAVTITATEGQTVFDYGTELIPKTIQVFIEGIFTPSYLYDIIGTTIRLPAQTKYTQVSILN